MADLQPGRVHVNRFAKVPQGNGAPQALAGSVRVQHQGEVVERVYVHRCGGVGGGGAMGLIPINQPRTNGEVGSIQKQ